MSLWANSQAELEKSIELLPIDSVFSISIFSNILQRSLAPFFK